MSAGCASASLVSCGRTSKAMWLWFWLTVAIMKFASCCMSTHSNFAQFMFDSSLHRSAITKIKHAGAQLRKRLDRRSGSGDSLDDTSHSDAATTSDAGTVLSPSASLGSIPPVPQSPRATGVPNIVVDESEAHNDEAHTTARRHSIEGSTSNLSCVLPSERAMSCTSEDPDWPASDLQIVEVQSHLAQAKERIENLDLALQDQRVRVQVRLGFLRGKLIGIEFADCGFCCCFLH